MRRKNYLAFLTVVCLFSCQQQNEQQDSSKEVINFSTSIDNESITDALTRGSNTLSLPVKDSFTAGDVISMSVSEQDYTPFTIGMDNLTWDEIDVDSETVTFCAHYPELSDAASTRAFGNRYREIVGGKEHLFGTAQAASWSRNVSLKFKRMTVPVVVLDENCKPYNGKAIIKFFLKNKGIQNLINGKIEVSKDAEPEPINISKIPEGSLTNLIPQVIKAGEIIGSVTLDGKEESIIAERDVNLSAGRALTMIMFEHRAIIDEQTPLRR